ncbi:uncharacterized protein LOC134191777 [Corticium candelabrum]|uniref:uncharacterized protein LOC134191777 n=1 Tax=Corticium candelabrum TaxID=121492 RepID=UPI002E265AEB|nr:uncharacterized protein LOC134191777 [Corticium candelabrum]
MRRLDRIDEFLLTLVRLRLGAPEEDLTYRFEVSQSRVSKILTNWLPFLAAQFKGLISWPTVGPCHGIFSNFPNTVAAMDCTQVFTERPYNLQSQKAMYSDYKSHTTIKYLGAVDIFTGAFVFLSGGQSGNASDRYMVETSGILDVLIPGQRVFADRGFKVYDLFAKNRAFLTIPSFMKGRAQLPANEALISRLMASGRIHVERAFGRLHEFRILNRVQPIKQSKGLLDDMVVIAAALCNLQPRLIKHQEM